MDDTDDTNDRLDATFGQYKALPISDDSSDVNAYLRSVRKEAELEKSVFYREKEEGKGKERLKRTSSEVEAEEKEGEEREEEEAKEDVDDDVDVEIAEEGEELENREIQEEEKDEEDVSLDGWKESLLKEFNDLKNAVASHPKPFPPVQALVPTTANQWRKYVLDNPPPEIGYFFEVLDRPTVIKLVVYYTKWLSLSANANLSQWIWMSLMRIDSALDYSECALIRDLGKKAVKLQEKISDENTTPVARYTFDMIIVLVSRYYGQRDIGNQENVNITSQ